MMIEQSLRILFWQDNLGRDEVPPVWMWSLDEELNEHFERVQEERDEKYGTGRDEDAGGEMTKNEYARGRGRYAK